MAPAKLLGIHLEVLEIIYLYIHVYIYIYDYILVYTAMSISAHVANPSRGDQHRKVSYGYIRTCKDRAEIVHT